MKSDSTEKIKIGLVGLGSIGRVHMDVLNNESFGDKFNLVAICDQYPKTTGAEYYSEYEKFLAHPGLQAVAIATPRHYDLTLAAIKAGKHVLIEKPPTLSMDQLDEIEKAGDEANVTVFTAFHSCFRPEVELAREELAGKEVRSIDILYREDVLKYCDPNGWIFDPQVAGGGVFMSSGINPVSIVTTVLPDISLKVTDVHLENESASRVESKGVVEFSFESGHGRLDMDWLHNGAESRLIRIQTPNDLYLIDIVKGVLKRDGVTLAPEQHKPRETVDQHLEYKGVYAEFYDLIANHRSLIRKRELEFMLNIYEVEKLGSRS